MVKAIDVWYNFMTDELIKEMFGGGPGGASEVAAATKTEKLDRQLPSNKPEDMVKRMDDAGVEITMFALMTQGHSRRMKLGQAPRLIVYNDWRNLLPYYEKFPTRFRGLYGINPWTGMDGVREMEKVVKDHKGFFCGAVTHTGGFAPFDDRIWWPFYAKCVELDIPLITQCGHFAESLPEAWCNPLQIDEVAEYFPELRIIAGHTGWPFTEELKGVCLKNENVYFSMEAYMPKYYDQSMVQFMNTRGRDRCMWGSDWPVTEAKPNLAQVAEIGLKDKVIPAFLRDNAVRVFKLKV
ncbi:MAG: amidohydrolase family protein [Dehalococcoidia bacterium]|nr:amidohydrolase family protein [Dehalococcoidia bacterium]